MSARSLRACFGLFHHADKAEEEHRPLTDAEVKGVVRVKGVVGVKGERTGRVMVRGDEKGDGEGKGLLRFVPSRASGRRTTPGDSHTRLRPSPVTLTPTLILSREHPHSHSCLGIISNRSHSPSPSLALSLPPGNPPLPFTLTLHTLTNLHSHPHSSPFNPIPVAARTHVAGE